MDDQAAHDRRELPERSMDAVPASVSPSRPRLRPSDIAIVGMSAIMPGAADLRRFWENILDKVGAIGEVPPERWPVERYFDSDRDAPDKINSKWGGFIPDMPFDPTRFGIPPASVPSVDPAQLLALMGAEAALADAGLASIAPELRRRASVILGFTGGLGELGVQYAARSELARTLPSTPAEALDFLPRWTSDSFSGLLPNVVAGRIANRLDLGGANFIVDAACAASLAALRQAVMELETGRSDLVLCGAVETGQGPFAFTCFSKAQALSPNGTCRAFDAGADGTAISEGIAFLVLRRLQDAEVAGDRIYAVIKGVDGTSDGRARGLMAPLPEGQKRALRRAYDQAGYSAASVDLFEAHGTGTVAGDAAEIESLSNLLLEDGAAPRTAAVGSVKTLIGHAKGAAGMAGLIKVVLGLHHRVIPPHAGVEQPNPALSQPDCPIALHQQARPWLSRPDMPRRGGVSAFGFGGANYHVTLEEHADPARHRAVRDRWPVELFVWRAADRASLATAVDAGLRALRAGATPGLGGLARALAGALGTGPATLAIVAGSHEALATLLAEAAERLRAADDTRPLPPGLYLAGAPLAPGGMPVMLFPGQGSQYPDMGRELGIVFDEVGAVLGEADAVIAETPTYVGRAETRLSRLVYPFERFSKEAEGEARRALAATDVAQPALGAVEAAMLALVTRLGIRPAAVAGHSYGEYVALHAAGVLNRRDLLRLSEARGRSIVATSQDAELGTMAAVSADAATTRSALGKLDEPGVVVANINGPNQTVISGERGAVGKAVAQLGGIGIAATSIPVSAAFHSPLMQPAQAQLARFFDEVHWARPRLPVYANTTADLHEAEPNRIRDLLERHLTEPVDFVGMIEAMYAAGGRVFLEVGPKSVLTTLTRRILGARPHAAVSLDGAGGGIVGLLHALAAIMVHGVQTDLSRLFAGRELALVDLGDWGREPERPVGHRPETWLLNGTRARPMAADVPTAVVPAPRPALVDATPHQGAEKATVARQTPTRGVKEIDMHGFDGTVRLDDDDPDDPQASGVDRAIADHHRTMRQFLQMQERLMLAYINSEGPALRPFSAPRPTSAARPAVSRAAPVYRSVERPAHASPAVLPVMAAAPAPKPAVVPVPAVATGPALSDPKTLLLRIVSERTGYPEDMLGLGLDMEADLGIDSIKRVEILGAFRKAQPAAISEQLSPKMAQIAKARTLQDVLDRLDSVIPEAEGANRPFDRAGTGQGVAALSRYIMRPDAEPLPPGQPAAVLPGTYLVLPDLGGLAAELGALLEADGARVRLVPDEVVRDEAAASVWLDTVRAAGRIRGLISLAAVAPPSSGAPDAQGWRAGMETSVKSVFGLLRLVAEDLTIGGVVVVASAMGGEFGRDSLRRSDRTAVFPGAGGGVGLVKCLAMEWPGCRCKAVDLDLDEHPAQRAVHLHAEIASPLGRREVGYPAGTRTIFRTELASLKPSPVSGEQPGPHWVVLAIGGARGITAETCRPFAQAGATCVVVGRSPLPQPEALATSELKDAGLLRRHFLAEAAASGVRSTPAKIEARISSVLRDREIRANMNDFVTLGGRIDYRICDVLHEAEVAAVLASVYATYGRIDAVLFGAGLIEDRLIVDKTRESLSRVFDTKVDGAFFVMRHLQPRTLKFLALFTSVAGRYGNRGQTDYGAANEVLNRFAWQLQARFGDQTKVTAVNWGAWARTTNGPGMLTPETARQFRDRGLRLIEPEGGSDFLWRELLYGSRQEVEVVAGEHPWDALEAEAAGMPAQDKRALGVVA